MFLLGHFRCSVSRVFVAVVCAALSISMILAKPAIAQVTAFKQAVAESAVSDEDIAAFYRSNGFAPIWTDGSDLHKTRRASLLHVINNAEDHGLPVARYDPAGLLAQLATAQTPRDRGIVEVEMTRVFLKYARDLQTGLLVPSRIDSRIVRDIPYRDRQETLHAFTRAAPMLFLRQLRPRTMEYTALMKEKMRMERLLAKGGWGPTVPADVLQPGASGAAVIALRNRLISMGYMPRTNGTQYDGTMKKAVAAFQLDHGMNTDGVAGAGTMAEINKGVQARLQSVIVAMERERWLNKERGERHVLVNIPDFTAKIIDNGEITFQTRSVVGAAKDDRPTPEFSDVMEFMVINPSWYVPRSIVTKEYLPKLKRNRNAVRHIEITDRRGRKVSRGAVNFRAYNARNFPFAMRQPPSKKNALGLVKFMFPNKYNIYLHDTPSKSLFDKDARAFSHGCVRLADPFDFAYTLLARQTADPKGVFHAHLDTGKEYRLDLVEPIPVHLIYRTAFTTAHGHTQYRNDIYGRDGRIWDALSKAGVALRAYQG